MEFNYGEALRKQFETESPELKSAREKYKKDTWVYLIVAKQLGMVNELFEATDGIYISIHNAGAVPIDELREATPEEIENWLKR
ncbi:MAG TPA: hypothetical protein VG621_03550 [Candidatus Paceibacterota bacterium]|nr:hypothetical protein [Candidatus Paceibacterota bacterium]